LIGRLTDASNATFLCRVETDTDDPLAVMQAVYKPTRGERPLDDFPIGTLANREVAAYLLSEATGWGIVPLTVLRDGPFGPGMVQLWVDQDPAADVLEMIVGGDPRLRPIAIFDVLANNADRKGSHLLPLASGQVHGVDHGICFAVEPKLRTVLWGWRGERLSEDEAAVVSSICDALEADVGRELETLLDPEEVRATAVRAETLLRTRLFPQPDPSRPALPWPPF